MQHPKRLQLLPIPAEQGLSQQWSQHGHLGKGAAETSEQMELGLLRVGAQERPLIGAVSHRLLLQRCSSQLLRIQARQQLLGRSQEALKLLSRLGGLVQRLIKPGGLPQQQPSASSWRNAGIKN